jgi:hypothetical protein
MKQWIQQFKLQYGNIRSVADVFNALGDKAVVKNLPFALYCALLTILYITTVHQNENRARRINDASKQLRELGWQYKDEKSKLMFLTKESELAKKAGEFGLLINTLPPKKLSINY